MADNYINQKRQQELANQHKDNLWWLYPMGAGLGAIGLGAFIYKSTASQGGTVVSNLMHFLGRPRGVAVNVDTISNAGPSAPSSGMSGIRSFLSATFNISKQKVDLGPIDLIRDLGGSLEIIGNTRAPVREAVQNRVTEAINRRYVNNANTASFFSQNLQRVTVGEVLQNKDIWSNLIGLHQWNVLSAASSRNLVSASTPLDRNIFKTSTGYLRDTRIRNIFMRSENGQLKPKIDFFSQFSSIKSLMGEGNRFAVLRNTPNVKGNSYFIDGNVYAYTKSTAGNFTEHLVETGKILRNNGDRLEPIRAAKEGRLKFDLKIRTSPLGGLVTQFEKATGVGTSFQNRYTFAQRWLVNPVKRLAGLSSGFAQVRKIQVLNSNRIEGIIDEFAGSTTPEIVRQGPRKTIIVGDHVDFKSLSGFEKIATIFGHSNKHTLINSGSGSYYDSILTGGVEPHLRPKDWFIPKPPEGGFKIESTKSEFYTAPESKLIPGITSLRDFASYSMYRVSHLASETLFGISFAPSASFLGNAARLAAIPMIYEAGRQLVNYADYGLESTIGFSPIKAAATIYTKIREAQQSVRSSLGIQQAAAELEKNFPGSMDTTGSLIARSIVAPAIAFASLSKFTSIGKAALGAAGVFGLIGGSDVQQTPEALAKEYAGDIKVPVRKGRWWSIGGTPYEGGDIERFDYSWYHKLKSDYKNKSIYGSSDEYWKYNANVFGIPLPTPSNWFGLRNILNPYRAEIINKDSRPYEETAPALSDIPIFGPALGETIGRLMKPSASRVPGPVAEVGLVPRGLTASDARSLGIPEMNISEIDFSPSLLDKVKKMADVASEPIGVYKFVMEYFGIRLEPKKEQLATSSNIDSVGKGLYDMDLGGGLGQTEFLRRFMLSDYHDSSQTARMVNRIRNNMPDWVPGSGSVFEKDKDYYIDYGTGSPFDKLTQGEARLPGRGYESLNKLESGQERVYSPVDRLLILSDIAPYSEAYKYYDNLVSKMKLAPEWQEKVKLAREYKEKSTRIDNRFPRYTDSLIAINERIKDSAAYKTTRGIYDTITHDVLSEIPLFGSKLFPFRDSYERYRKEHIEGSQFASWFTPWEDIQRPALTDMALSNPLVGALKGGTIGFLLGGPMSWASPLSIGPSTSIVGGMIVGGALSAGRIALGVSDNYVPDHVREESNTNMYLDSLSYIKNRALEERANSMGVSSSEFRKNARKTLVGANTPIMLRASLPTSLDKKYFDQFLETPVGNREQLLAGVSPHLAYALNKAWGMGYNSQQSADTEAVARVSDVGVPSFDSLAWHPMVDNRSMGLKLVTHGLNGVSDNYHRYGFYEANEATIRTRMPDLWNESTTFVSPPNFASAKEYIQNIGQNIDGRVTTSVTYTPYRAKYTQKLQIDRSKDNLPIIQGRY